MLSSSDDEAPRPHNTLGFDAEDHHLSGGLDEPNNPLSFDAEDHHLPSGLDELFEDDGEEYASPGRDEDDNHLAFIPDNSDEYHFTVETGSPSTRQGGRRLDPGSPSFDYNPDPIYSYLMGRDRDHLDLPDEQLSDVSHLANASPRAVMPPLDVPATLAARARARSPVPSVRVRNDGREPSPILLQVNHSAIWDKAGLPGYKFSEPLRRRKKPGQPHPLTGEKEWLYTGHDEYEGKYPHDYPGEALGPNARVWRVYCDEAQIYDDDMIRGWNTTVDGLLVFL
ncbi:hypothetical protein EWM64_g7298 [Hericium alpestre]|uniref:DUF6535 domain-containing protein n=1 Tax=Hericium alpestre TaxID=135208 RepID=A0A4Y9ZRQ2_9AGAM|nr:hypothetical protein EWM64_g7298 [Hericium alpestre]